MTTVLVAFPDVWITNVADPSVSVIAASTNRAANAAMTGRVGIYAGGRRRVITTPADTVTYPLVLSWVSDPDTATLLSWRGQVLLLRDTLGRRVFGTFLDVAQADIVSGMLFFHDLTLTFTELDYSEAV